MAVATTLDGTDYVVSRHALVRYREHEPDATPATVAEAVHAARVIDNGLAAAILCRPLERVRDEYRLSATGRGIFVLRPETEPRVVVTYLRLSPSQRAILLRRPTR